MSPFDKKQLLDYINRQFKDAYIAVCSVDGCDGLCMHENGENMGG